MVVVAAAVVSLAVCWWEKGAGCDRAMRLSRFSACTKLADLGGGPWAILAEGGGELGRRCEVNEKSGLCQPAVLV